jgi:serine/threonine protein kinase
MDPTEKIYDYFHWKDVIQEDGDGGKVVVCRKKAEETKEYNYVLKIRSKASIGSFRNQKEFRCMLMKMLNIPPHNGVMPYLEVLEDDTHFYCVMEKAAGGSLFRFLVTKHADGCVPESEMKELMREILQAVGHVHKQGMIHRDIKPDNIVVRKVDDPNSPDKLDCVTLIDFDHAETNYTPFTPCVNSEHTWGTTGYNAPETYLGHYSPASDLFSVGVTLYMLMTGKMPYDVKALKLKEDEPESPSDWCRKVYYKMKEADVDWSCDPWPKNEACRSFCQSLLASKASKRLASVEEALQHEWLADVSGSDYSTPNCQSPEVEPAWLQALFVQPPALIAAEADEAALVSAEAYGEESRFQISDRQPSRTVRKDVKHIIDAMRAVDPFSEDLIEPWHAQPVLPVANGSTKIKSKEEETAPLAVRPMEIEVEHNTTKSLLPDLASKPSRGHRFRRIEGFKSQLLAMTPQPPQPFGVMPSSNRSSRRMKQSSSSRPVRTVRRLNVIRTGTR